MITEKRILQKREARTRWRNKNPKYINKWRKRNKENDTLIRHKAKERSRILNNQLKLERGGKCSMCGFTDMRALTWHHLRDKKYNISELAGSGRVGRLVEEIKKCILLCSNCHLILHSEDEKCQRTQ